MKSENKNFELTDQELERVSGGDSDDSYVFNPHPSGTTYYCGSCKQCFVKEFFTNQTSCPHCGYPYASVKE